MQILFRTPEGEVERTARRLVLAMPPRLIEEHIFFSPALLEQVQRSLLARPTWMARQAKAVVVYGTAVDFRATAGSGNAFVHHERAVLSEVFDASSMDGGGAALGGFLALPPAERARLAKAWMAFFCGIEVRASHPFTEIPLRNSLYRFELERMHRGDLLSFWKGFHPRVKDSTKQSTVIAPPTRSNIETCPVSNSPISLRRQECPPFHKLAAPFNSKQT